MTTAAHCTWCHKPGQPYTYQGTEFSGLTPCEGERLCPACTGAYLDEALGDATAAVYGERYRCARGSDVPVIVRAFVYGKGMPERKRSERAA